MDLRPVLYVIGILLTVLAVSLALPMMADLYFGYADWKVFFICMVITAFFGGSLILSNAGQQFKITTRQAFFLTTMSWLTMATFGALPFMLSEMDMSLADAFFESMSGITTTGSTVIVGLDDAPPGILLWRSLLQGLGGLGFVVMALAVLPFLKVGGMQLFKTESSEREKALPRAAQYTRAVAVIYFGLILACAIGYMATGMGAFDAIAHAMPTVATGGFSTSDSSFMNYEHPGSEIVCIIFMILGALPFVLFVKAMGGNFRAIIQDSQVQWFLVIVVTSIIILTLYLVTAKDFAFLEALRRVSFNVVSVITSTGFANADYIHWGPFAGAVLFALMMGGACSGSTAGAIKVFRLQILYVVTSVQVKRLLHPHGVFNPQYNGRPVPKDVPMAVMSFFFLYILVFALFTITLTFFDLDLVTAATAVAACQGNVGPGLGNIVGPAGTFKPLPDGVKWILSFAMLLGRLELFTVLVLFSPSFWRR